MTVMRNSIFTSIYRTFITNCESRRTTFSFIQKLVDDAFEMCNRIVKRDSLMASENSKALVTMLIRDLEKSKIGIINLGKSYENDKMFCAKLDTLIEMIDTRILSFGKSNPWSVPAAKADVNINVPEQDVE